MKKDLIASGQPLPNAPDLQEPQGLPLTTPAGSIKVGDRVIFQGDGAIHEWTGVVTDILPNGIMVHWHAEWPTIPVMLFEKFFDRLTFHPSGPVEGASVGHIQEERIKGRITGVCSDGYMIETTENGVYGISFMSPLPFDLAYVLSWGDE